MMDFSPREDAEMSMASKAVLQGIEGDVAAKSDMIINAQRTNEETFAGFKAEIARLIYGVNAESAARQKDGQGVSLLMSELRERSEVEIRRERWERTTMEAQIERIANEHLEDARAAFEEHMAVRAQAEGTNYAKEVSHELCQLYGDLELARNYRNQKAEHLIQGVKQKLLEVQLAAAAEQRMREESEQTMLELFGKMAERLNGMLEQTRRDRVLATERILQVMEDVAPSLDRAATMVDCIIKDKDTEVSSGASDAKDLANNARKSMTRRATLVLTHSGAVFRPPSATISEEMSC